MKKIAGAIILLLILGCNNANDLRFTGKNTEEVMQKIRQSKDLTGEEVGFLVAGMARYAITDKSLEGKAVKDVIAEQKKIAQEAETREAEARRLAEEAAKKEAALAAELAKYIVLAPYKKSFTKADFMSGTYEDRINMTFVVENKGAKDIRAFKGITKFKDLFGEEITSSQFSCDQPIKAGQKGTWSGSKNYNQFDVSDKKFRNTELVDMKFEWIPKAIIFTDGTTLDIDQRN